MVCFRPSVWFCCKVDQLTGCHLTSGRLRGSVHACLSKLNTLPMEVCRDKARPVLQLLHTSDRCCLITRYLLTCCSSGIFTTTHLYGYKQCAVTVAAPSTVLAILTNRAPVAKGVRMVMLMTAAYLGNFVTDNFPRPCCCPAHRLIETAIKTALSPEGREMVKVSAQNGILRTHLCCSAHCSIFLFFLRVYA